MWISESIDIFPLKNAQFRRAQEYLAGIETQLSSEGRIILTLVVFLMIHHLAITT